MKKKNRQLENEMAETLLEKKNEYDKSPIVHQRPKLKSPLHIVERPDFTPKQKELIQLILNKDVKMVMIDGPAGTTKTYIAIYTALKLLNEKRVSDIIYVRSAVESSEKSIGALPGLLDEKFSVYLEPLVDKLSELLPKNEIDLLKKEERIRGIPCNFLRGLSFNAKAIITDETQNMSVKEIVTFMTRTGEYSKVIMMGDSLQNDINGKSGFKKMFNLFNDDDSRNNGIYTFQFTEDDILRSKLVKFIVKKVKNILN